MINIARYFFKFDLIAAKKSLNVIKLTSHIKSLFLASNAFEANAKTIHKITSICIGSNLDFRDFVRSTAFR